jgi:hypothetical protein
MFQITSGKYEVKPARVVEMAGERLKADFERTDALRGGAEAKVVEDCML